MNQIISRRSVLKSTTLAAAGLAASPFLSRIAFAQEAGGGGAKKKVLFFTKSQTFQHSMVARPTPETLSPAEQILTDLGAKLNIEVTCSKDGRLFTPENLASYDAFVFYTTGDLTKPSYHDSKTGQTQKPTPDTPDNEPPMTPEGKQAFLDAIKSGKGFVGFHAATDTFHSAGHVRGQANLLRDVNDKGEDQFDPYIQMIGGEFIVHGKQQPSTLRCVDPKWPGAKAFDGAKITEEWYSLKNFAPDLHVILAQDPAGMTGPMYQRGAFPETWARLHGQGRVFYTSMGHREDVWKKPEYIDLITNGLLWAVRRLDADVPPNYKEATPEADVKKPA